MISSHWSRNTKHREEFHIDGVCLVYNVIRASSRGCTNGAHALAIAVQVFKDMLYDIMQ